MLEVVLRIPASDARGCRGKSGPAGPSCSEAQARTGARDARAAGRRSKWPPRPVSATMTIRPPANGTRTPRIRTNTTAGGRFPSTGVLIQVCSYMAEKRPGMAGPALAGCLHRLLESGMSLPMGGGDRARGRHPRPPSRPAPGLASGAPATAALPTTTPDVGDVIPLRPGDADADGYADGMLSASSRQGCGLLGPRRPAPYRGRP